ncbi:transporter substrate-binding domain-containing protein [Streptomyces sp. ET3-23]|uniref:transporter substrate-binding domain-containing protein n=1 Tax=Streptomyces sp. ET3-23 TaxID=2885643 RepID=UPI001D111E75|nr:transporter substrate-binding domain-containing protein [Streptomyces sp. ET3-23]MCC2276294.1 transporter substrate-binding domain-containing protein [Streptomyces sp. ET3-23]
MQRKPGPCTRAALQLAALVVLTALPLTAACDSTGGSAQFLGRNARDSIVIGVKSDQPGTGWQTDGYKYSGFDIKVADALTKDLHIGKTFSNVPSEDRVAALTQSDANHVDLVIATFSITKERMKRIWFAGPYAETQQGFLVRRDGPAVKSLGDLRGKPVCAWNGTVSAEALQNRAQGLGTYEAPTAAQCVDDLRSGRAAAFSTDQLILHGFAARYSELEVVPDVVIGSANYYGVGMAKKDPNGRSNLRDCRRIRDALKRYVGTSAWDLDLKTELPLVEQAPDWRTRYRPSPADIDRLSCTDDVEG